MVLPMETDDISLSEAAREQCDVWDVSPEEVIEARLNGERLIPESVMIEGREVYWGPERADGTHLHVVCSPTPFSVNDFRPLKKRPMYEKPRTGKRSRRD